MSDVERSTVIKVFPHLAMTHPDTKFVATKHHTHDVEVDEINIYYNQPGRNTFRIDAYYNNQEFKKFSDLTPNKVLVIYWGPSQDGPTDETGPWV